MQTFESYIISKVVLTSWGMLQNTKLKTSKCYRTWSQLLVARKPILRDKYNFQKIESFQGRTVWRRDQKFIIFHCVQIFFWLVGGKVTGGCSSSLVISLKLPSSAWVGALVPAEKNSKILLVVSLEGEPRPCPTLHYCFLTILPLCLHDLTSLVSNWLKLLFGTQRRSRRRNEAYFLQTRNRGHRRDLYGGGPHRVLLHFTNTISDLMEDPCQTSNSLPLHKTALPDSEAQNESTKTAV